MKTFPNTKEIPAKLLYEMLKDSFGEFDSNSLSRKSEFNYGLGEDMISVERPDGTQIYTIDVTPLIITVTETADQKSSTGDSLNEFIESCLK